MSHPNVSKHFYFAAFINEKAFKACQVMSQRMSVSQEQDVMMF